MLLKPKQANGDCPANISVHPYYNRTHTAAGSDLCVGVVAAVALAPDDPCPTLALACMGVTGTRHGSQLETFTGVAGITAFWPEIVILQNGGRVVQQLADLGIHINTCRVISDQTRA